MTLEYLCDVFIQCVQLQGTFRPLEDVNSPLLLPVSLPVPVSVPVLGVYFNPAVLAQGGCGGGELYEETVEDLSEQQP